jgi:cell pole-organizing protein PopZ
VLDLTEAMAAVPPAPPQPSSSFRTIDSESDVVFSDRPPEPEPIRAVEEARRQFTQTTDRSLMSNSTMAAVDSAFSSLAHTVLGNNARTLEDLVKEMLRPMLKSWLDDNLPGLVERLVRAEIERVSRGRG